MDPLERHVAGATVVHKHPFAALALPAPPVSLSRDAIIRWVGPLYMKIFGGASDPELGPLVVERWPDVTEPVMHALLVDFNWRSRIVGAWLAALKQQRSLTELIGRLLLRSDVCYAGKGYCLALARFNTAESIGFVLEYLGYYLTRIDLTYDQGWAMGAIAYLDRHNGTDNLGPLTAAWDRFVADRPHWQLDKSITGFERQMASLHAIAQRCASR
jgi:hypothetical protein